MRYAAVSIITAVALSVPASAQAQEPSGDADTVRTLMLGCEGALRGEWSDPISFYCLGVVAGISWMMESNCISVSYGRTPVGMLTAGDIPTIDAGAQAFATWARANPSRWGDNARLSMIEVFHREFPCEFSE